MGDRNRGRELERVLATHAAALARLAASYESRPALREELLQDIAFALWRALPSFRHEASEKTFVMRIATNRALSHLAGRPPDGGRSGCGRRSRRRDAAPRRDCRAHAVGRPPPERGETTSASAQAGRLSSPSKDSRMTRSPRSSDSPRAMSACACTAARRCSRRRLEKDHERPGHRTVDRGVARRRAARCRPRAHGKARTQAAHGVDRLRLAGRRRPSRIRRVALARTPHGPPWALRQSASAALTVVVLAFTIFNWRGSPSGRSRDPLPISSPSRSSAARRGCAISASDGRYLQPISSSSQERWPWRSVTKAWTAFQAC